MEATTNTYRSLEDYVIKSAQDRAAQAMDEALLPACDEEQKKA